MAFSKTKVLLLLLLLLPKAVVGVPCCTLTHTPTHVCLSPHRAFFNVVAGLALTLTFFASWMSFNANVRENSREFGVLRALGLNVGQVLRVYVYEALMVVMASFILGTTIGRSFVSVYHWLWR